MKKRLLIILTSVTLFICLALSGCGSGGLDNEQADEESETTIEDLAIEEDEDADTADEVPHALVIYDTLEDALPVLEEDGYEKTDSGYVAEDSDDEVSSKRIVTAEGNTVHADLSYTYNKGGRKMARFFKKNDEAVYIMVSSFITRLADETEIEDGTLTYVIRVNDKVVREGEMSLDEANEYQSMADD